MCHQHQLDCAVQAMVSTMVLLLFAHYSLRPKHTDNVEGAACSHVQCVQYWH